MKKFISLLVASSIVLSPLSAFLQPLPIANAQTSTACPAGMTCTPNGRTISVVTQAQPETWQKASDQKVVWNTAAKSGEGPIYVVFLSTQPNSATPVASSDIHVTAAYNGSPQNNYKVVSNNGVLSISRKIDQLLLAGTPLGSYYVKVVGVYCSGSTVNGNVITELLSNTVKCNSVNIGTSNITGKPILKTVIPEISLGTSTSMVTIAPAPDPFVTVTNPIDGDVWMAGTRHKITWVANFIKGTNNTGLSQYNGIHERALYGIGVNPYNHGGSNMSSIAGQITTSLAENLVTQVATQGIIMFASSISWTIPFIGPILGIAASILSWTGVFDEQPQGVTERINIVPFDPATGTLGQPVQTTTRLTEQSMATLVLSNKVVPGTYKIQAIAVVNKNTQIATTSGMFTVVIHVKTDITSVNISTDGTKITVNGNGYSATNNTLIIRDNSGKLLSTINNISSDDGMSLVTSVTAGSISSSAKYRFVVSNTFATSSAFVTKPAVFDNQDSSPSDTTTTTTTDSTQTQSGNSSTITILSLTPTVLSAGNLTSNITITGRGLSGVQLRIDNQTYGSSYITSTDSSVTIDAKILATLAVGSHAIALYNSSGTSSPVPFQVQAGVAGAPSITVTSPNGGEMFRAGVDPLSVSWVGTNLASNDGIQFSLVGTNGIVTVANAMGTGLDLKAAGGSAILNPGSIQSGSYRLKITDDYGNTDMSNNYFTITAPATINTNTSNCATAPADQVYTGTTAGSVWGSGPYTNDSAIAAAAVHQGLLTAGQSGVIRVTSVGTLLSFTGSTKNGVTTYPWGSFCGVTLSLVGVAQVTNNSVNYSALNTALATAHVLINSASIGTGPGQYAQNIVNSLNSSINFATGIGANATQATVDSAVRVLNKGISDFTSSVNPAASTGTTGTSGSGTNSNTNSNTNTNSGSNTQSNVGTGVSAYTVLLGALTNTIASAQDTLNNAKVGTTVGYYPQSAATILNNAIVLATASKNNAFASQSELSIATQNLQNAVATFNSSVITTNPVDKASLISQISSAQAIRGAAVVGTANGNFTQSAVNTLDNAILLGTTIRDRASASQADVNTAVSTLQSAVTTFNASALVVTAVRQYTVGSAAVTPGGDTNGGSLYTAGASMSFVAYPEAGHHFVKWTDTNDVLVSTANPYNITVSKDVALRAYFALGDPLTVSLTANNTANGITIAKATGVTLRWTVTGGATSCTGSGNWTGAKAKAGGSQILGQISANKTYTLTCVNANGESTSSSVTVTISPTASTGENRSNTATIWDALKSFFGF